MEHVGLCSAWAESRSSWIHSKGALAWALWKTFISSRSGSGFSVIAPPSTHKEQNGGADQLSSCSRKEWPQWVFKCLVLNRKIERPSEIQLWVVGTPLLKIAIISYTSNTFHVICFWAALLLFLFCRCTGTCPCNSLLMCLGVSCMGRWRTAWPSEAQELSSAKLSFRRGRRKRERRFAGPTGCLGHSQLHVGSRSLPVLCRARWWGAAGGGLAPDLATGRWAGRARLASPPRPPLSPPAGAARGAGAVHRGRCWRQGGSGGTRTSSLP